MRPRNLLLLFLLVAGLGAFIYFVDRDLPSTDEQTQEAGKLLPLESDEVTQLVLTHGEETVRFERTPAQEVDGKPGVPGDWGLTEPLVARADQGAVDRLVSTLTSLRTERTLEDYDAAGLGLEAPRATVMLGTGKATTTVRVGAEIPASSTTVVAIDGRSFAYVIQDSVVSELLRSVGEWRARDLLPGTRPEIRTVALSTADRTVVVARQGDRDEFTFEVPGKELSDRLAEDHADTLLKALTGLRVERFLDAPAPNPESLGLEPPTTTVEVSFADKPDFHLEVGNTVPDQVGRYYGRVGDHLYEISTELPQLAREDLDSWRSKAWSALPVYLVDGATMTLDGTTVELHRDGSDWRRGDDLVAYDTVSELLYAVHDVQADEILPPARAAGLPKEPKLHLHLTTSTGEEDLSLYPVEGHFVARTEGRDVLLELPAETGDKIVRIATELRDAPAQPEKPPTGNDETSDPELDDGG